MSRLRDRQIDVIVLAAQGLPSIAIGRRLGISQNSVKAHISKLLAELGAKDRAHALALAVADGLVDIRRGEDGGLVVAPRVRDLGLVPCPSLAAYYRHRKRGEEACAGCREVLRVETARKRAVA